MGGVFAAVPPSWPRSTGCAATPAASADVVRMNSRRPIAISSSRSSGWWESLAQLWYVGAKIAKVAKTAETSGSRDLAVAVQEELVSTFDNRWRQSLSRREGASEPRGHARRLAGAGAQLDPRALKDHGSRKQRREGMALTRSIMMATVAIVFGLAGGLGAKAQDRPARTAEPRPTKNPLDGNAQAISNGK